MILALLAALVLAGAPAPSSSRPPPPARVQVVALDFEYRLSRTRVLAGPALIELVNFGEDEHDLRLRRIGGTRTFVLRAIAPGARKTLALRLLPGRYRLWCGVGEHAPHGMRAELRVARRPVG